MSGVDGVFNIAKGKVGGYYDRVKNNDPANSGIVFVVLSTTPTDATLKDCDTLAAVIAAGGVEATNSGYVRKTLTDADLAASAPDDTNDRMPLDTGDFLYSAVSAAGGAWVKGIYCYDPDVTGGTDADLIPLTFHNLAITPDGNNVTIAV